MVSGEQQPHRPGALKQQNKQHKSGKHRSKGGLERESKGRVEAKLLSKKLKRDLKKLDRRHKASQLRRQRKDAVFMEKRNLGNKDGPPHLVVIVPLHARIDAQEALKLIQSQDSVVVHQSEEVGRSFSMVCPRFKQRWSFVLADVGNFYELLDLAKVADTLLFMLDPNEGWDSYGDYCLSCLFAQGLPSYVLAVQGLNSIPLKKRSDVKRIIGKTMDKRFPDAKLFSMDTVQEAALLLRQVTTQKQRHLAFRDRRSYLMAQRVDFLPSDSSGLVGTVKLSGYIRGQILNVNSLVHIVGIGDFQMSQIDASADPCPLNPRGGRTHTKKGDDTEMKEEPIGGELEEEPKVLMKADPKEQESLLTEAIPDPMEGEQTWPTEEELKEAEDSVQKKKNVVRKVPKGTSEYQAAWILDDDESGAEKSSSEDDDDDYMEEVEDGAMDETVSGEDRESEDEELEESESLTGAESTQDEQYDEKVDGEEDELLHKYKQQRAEEMFPDEVDTPRDQVVRVRYQKYRGLKSFRTSPWDPKENLPRDYSRIFQFHDFARTRKRIFQEIRAEEAEGAMVGWFVTIHISRVPVSVKESFQNGAPVILCSLLPHEQKMSVVNMAVRRYAGNSEPLKSKEELIFQCGFRRFRASPLYSQHTTANKHKCERFLPSDTTVIVTVYAPIMFPPASVLMFKQRNNGMHDLVATGSLLSVDPDRILVKRIVLSGHPFKILKRTAVVRFMFFNREDVLWFKPVELRTKWGRRGHIKEALGTHGHMKCHFDGQLKSQDTVLINLYKRVFPKWTYDPYVPEPVPWTKNEHVVDVQEIDME
ncbi:pre-rRNA-processing protein TSR1 homolog [Ambystoma mexicanum]|uniref:pre-rRNA-processing protein TSR1 homolog n=1 Tax=Ambystoma mexicanum TaxID=8296 RepID=UPI0037E855EA